jgi:hypothetical protein
MFSDYNSSGLKSFKHYKYCQRLEYRVVAQNIIHKEERIKIFNALSRRIDRGFGTHSDIKEKTLFIPRL